MRKRTKPWICSRVEDTASEAQLVAFQAGANFLVSRKRTGGVIGQTEHFTQVTVQENVAHLKEETPWPEMKVDSSYVKDGDPVVKVGYGCEGSSHGNGFRFKTASGRSANSVDWSHLKKSIGDGEMNRPLQHFQSASQSYVLTQNEKVTICPGDSGGPLLKGSKVVGINSAMSAMDLHTRLVDPKSGNRVLSWLKAQGIPLE